MERNKKDAAQDVLNLYNQMQEDETIESGKKEIHATLNEIESAKEALSSVKRELAEANRALVSTMSALLAAQKSTENIVGSICNAIVKAEQSNLKVGINDEGLALLNERNSTAISALKQALDEHEKRINNLFVRKHSVNHVFSSPTSIINFTSKKPSYDDTRRSGRDNELLQRAQNDL